MSITQEQKAIIKSTAPILKENGKEIASMFYKQMFENHPELLDIFNQTNQKIGTQPLALANTIYFAAENIDNLETIMPLIKHITHKHRALTIQPEHYPIVGKYLLLAIQQFLGDKSTQDILDAWAAAYNIIANIFIDIEKQLYDELGPNEEDKGFVPLTIVKKEVIAHESIVALTLEHPQNGKMFKFHVGQYLTIRIRKDGNFHNRHYSLTRPFDGKSYSIAIKIENMNEIKGVVSNEIINNYNIGDTILASFPAGTFQLVENGKHHLFIGGGVGITVLSSMIHELNKQGKSNDAILIHCVPSEEYAAFNAELKSILPEGYYQLFCKDQRLGKDDLEKVLKSDTQVYICGSVPFMDRIESLLVECGHPSSQIHVKAFQPTLSTTKDAVKDEAETKVL
ncbi:unnamed protein product [Adineta steineri]|uniref:nitric oxide dioxygenase n=1 Tax=Adineta steineri TaxID=433720 RepID=A0A814V062_9BILA|nr:unnamed protein product [Adineta steineri]CAF1415317.1 unnamed protein product [Adineta steineri]